MAQVIWTEPALSDLDRIADYISLDNPAAAKKLVRDVFNRIKRLNKYPKLGKPIPELEKSIYRELVVPPCRIFYRIEKEKLYIIHVMRSEQLLKLDLLKSGL